jgi:hypothetical protein
MNNSAETEHDLPQHVERQLLYLASVHSHTRLRNANLPRFAGTRDVQQLVRKGYLSVHSVPYDHNGSCCEYLLQARGVARLAKLNKAMDNEERSKD